MNNNIVKIGVIGLGSVQQLQMLNRSADTDVWCV